MLSPKYRSRVDCPCSGIVMLVFDVAVSAALVWENLDGWYDDVRKRETGVLVKITTDNGNFYIYECENVLLEGGNGLF